MSREHLYKAKRVNWRELPKEEWWVEGFYVQLPKPSLGATIIAGGDLCAEDVADYIIVNKSNQHSNFSNAYPLEVVECEQYEVDPETVCEYTQMTDINKNKIWENDIVLVEHSKMDKESDNAVFMPDIIKYTRNYAIEFVNKGGHCGYRCRNKSIHFTISGNTVYNHKIVVIGNVFDNLELLEGGVAE